MSLSLKGLSKVLMILIGGLAIGYGSLVAVPNLIVPQYSSFAEKGKPAEPELPRTAPADRLAAEEAKPDPGVQVVTQVEIPVMVLRKENTLVFNEVVTDLSVAKFQVQLQEMSNRLPDSQEIIIVLYTPGGSVDAGSQLMDSVKAIPQPVKTLTLFSASMGFQFVQNFGERMITPSGILMSHRAYGGMEGEIGGEFDVRYDAVKRQIEFMDQKAANRMGLSLKQYRDLIRDEYWVHGFDSVADKAADKMILARCDKDMAGTTDKEFMTLFGPIQVTFSKCPLITGPLDIKFNGMSEEGLEEAHEFMNLLYQNPRQFVNQYIKTMKYEKFLKVSK